MGMKHFLIAVITAGACAFGMLPSGHTGAACAQEKAAMETEGLQLTQGWDKVFPRNEKVKHRKVTFANRFGITLAADLYEPLHAEGRLPALAVCGAFGAV